MSTPRYINIPCSITIEIPDEDEADFDLDTTSDETLMDYVVAQHGRYPVVDARYLGYELAEEA